MHPTLPFVSYKMGQHVFYVAATAPVTHSNLEKGRLCEPASLSYISDRQAKILVEMLQKERKDTRRGASEGQRQDCFARFAYLEKNIPGKDDLFIKVKCINVF